MIDPHKANYGGTPGSAWRKKLSLAPPERGVTPVVSIVTPFHDGAPVFRETVTSVLGQSLQAWEWVIVDDASTDPASIALLEGLEREDARIRVVRHPENLGRSAARNTGVREAATDLLYPLDQDDLLEPTALEKTLWFLLTHPEHAFANAWCVGFGAQSYLWSRGFEQEHEFLGENQVSGRALIRRSVFETVGGYDESLREGYEDWDFWLRCAERNLWGATIPEHLEWFRRKMPPASWEDPARMAAFREALRERHPRLVAGAFPKTVRRADPSPPAIDLPFENPTAPHPRRVLLLASSLDFHAGGGRLLGVADVLSKQGWQLTVAVATERDGAECERALGRHSADVFALDRFLPAQEQPRFLRYLVASRGMAVVLCESNAYGRFLADWLRACDPAPLYAELVDDDPNRAEAPLDPRREDASRSPFDLRIASTHALAEALRTGSHEVAQVPPTVDTTAWKPRREPRRWLRPHWGAERDDVIVLFTGRLCERNRPRVVCRTLLELARRDAPFRAVLQGDGEDAAWIREFVARHALESRVRLEPTPGADWLLKSMAAADLFLAPARDGLPILALRAMAMGLPIVAAEGAALAEAVDGEVGIVVGERDDDAEVGAFADAIERLGRDADLRRRLSQTARRRVLGRFGPDKVAARVLDRLAQGERAVRPAVDAREAFARAVEAAELFGRADALERERLDLLRLTSRQREQLRELAQWNEDQARARSWLESQVQNWEQIARRHGDLLAQRERSYQEVAQARAWLEGQAESWRSVAQQREEMLAQRDQWVSDLQEARRWLEGQRENWHKISQQNAEQATRAIEEGRRWQQLAEEHARRIADTEERSERWRLLAEDHASRLELLEKQTAALQQISERLANEQRAVAHRLAALARRWWPGELRRGAAEASRKLLAGEPVDR